MDNLNVGLGLYIVRLDNFTFSWCWVVEIWPSTVSQFSMILDNISIICMSFPDFLDLIQVFKPQCSNIIHMLKKSRSTLPNVIKISFQKKTVHTVEGSEIRQTHQLRLVVYSPVFSRWLAEFLNRQLPRSSDLPVDVKLKTALVHDEHVTRWFNGWEEDTLPQKNLLRLAPKRNTIPHWKTSKSSQAGLKKIAAYSFEFSNPASFLILQFLQDLDLFQKLLHRKWTNVPKKRGHHFSGDMLVSERVCFMYSCFLFFPFPACLLDFFLILPSSRWFHFLHPFLSFPFLLAYINIKITNLPSKELTYPT